MMPESWISRILKKKKKNKSKSGSSGLKNHKSDPYEGIDDFSEVAAVFDFYEVCTIGSSYFCRRNGRDRDRRG